MLSPPVIAGDAGTSVIIQRPGAVRTLEGCASVFGAIAIAKRNGNRRIRVAPGAFILPSAADPYDIPLIIGHNADGTLGSLADGTLKVWQDGTGLYYRWTPREAGLRLLPRAVAGIAQGLWGSCVHIAGGFERTFGWDEGGRVETVTRAYVDEISIGPGGPSGYCPGTWCRFADRG